MTQLKQVVAWTDNYAEQRIVAGDFNFWNTTSQYTEMSKTHNDGRVARGTKAPTTRIREPGW